MKYKFHVRKCTDPWNVKPLWSLMPIIFALKEYQIKWHFTPAPLKGEIRELVIFLHILISTLSSRKKVLHKTEFYLWAPLYKQDVNRKSTDPPCCVCCYLIYRAPTSSSETKGGPQSDIRQHKTGKRYSQMLNVGFGGNYLEWLKRYADNTYKIVCYICYQWCQSSKTHEHNLSENNLLNFLTFLTFFLTHQNRLQYHHWYKNHHWYKHRRLKTKNIMMWVNVLYAIL